MKILVAAKRVPDTDQKIRLREDGSGIDDNDVTYIVNPFDAIAVEAALRICETRAEEVEVVVVTIGPDDCESELRTSLAMGADRAILIETDEQPEPLAVAKLLKAVVDRENPGMVILGKQAIDGDNNQTGQMLAALLGWSIGTFVSKLTVEADTIKVTREVDGGLENLELVRPSVVTVDLRLNEPRYASLPNIMKAKKKPLDTLNPEELAVDISPRLEVVSVVEPPARSAGVKVESAAELVDKLKNEAKVI